MSIELIFLAGALATGLAIGALIGWLAGRPAQARLAAELERDRAVHAERVKVREDAEANLRGAFQALSSEPLPSNNRAFLDLAET